MPLTKVENFAKFTNTREFPKSVFSRRVVTQVSTYEFPEANEFSL